MKTPVTVAPEALDFAQLIRQGDTIGWAEATAEPVLLTRLLNAQAPRCPPFRVFFALMFGAELAAGHPNVTVTAFGGGGAGRRFFAEGAGNVIPANISNLCDLVASGRIPAEKMGTHSFTFDQIDEAYDVFANAAANLALKVVITP